MRSNCCSVILLICSNTVNVKSVISLIRITQRIRTVTSSHLRSSSLQPANVWGTKSQRKFKGFLFPFFYCPVFSVLSNSDSWGSHFWENPTDLRHGHLTAQLCSDLRQLYAYAYECVHAHAYVERMGGRVGGRERARGRERRDTDRGSKCVFWRNNKYRILTFT